MTCNNPRLDLVNMNAYIKFGEILSICSQDKQNLTDRMTKFKDGRNDGQPKSNIVSTFSKQGYNNIAILSNKLTNFWYFCWIQISCTSELSMIFFYNIWARLHSCKCNLAWNFIPYNIYFLAIFFFIFVFLAARECNKYPNLVRGREICQIRVKQLKHKFNTENWDS